MSRVGRTSVKLSGRQVRQGSPRPVGLESGRDRCGQRRGPARAPDCVPRRARTSLGSREARRSTSRGRTVPMATQLPHSAKGPRRDNAFTISRRFFLRWHTGAPRLDGSSIHSRDGLRESAAFKATVASGTPDPSGCRSQNNEGQGERDIRRLDRTVDSGSRPRWPRVDDHTKIGAAGVLLAPPKAVSWRVSMSRGSRR
jgi:hypothetical protein